MEKIKQDYLFIDIIKKVVKKIWMDICNSKVVTVTVKHEQTKTKGKTALKNNGIRNKDNNCKY